MRRQVQTIKCHCPIDQQSLENIWSNREELDSNKKLGNREYFLQSWGKENFKEENGKKKYPVRYKLFQEAVRSLADKENINPLEYDYCYVWQLSPSLYMIIRCNLK